jgi:hypothetical protein
MTSYTTISVSEETRRRLLQVAAKLQARLGEKVDYDRAIAQLIAESGRSVALLREACSPVGLSASELREALAAGRREDRAREERLER